MPASLRRVIFQSVTATSNK
uniref:Uncharacterized protein n=1 Tax=Rhizophora mucronata TaxID=61149 RepID=A0A2P2NHW5_RHIMU